MGALFQNAIIKKYNNPGGSYINATHLSNIFDDMGKPYQFPVMMELFSASTIFGGKFLLGSTGGKRNYTSIPQMMYEWELKGADERRTVVLENLDPTLTAPGINNTTFRLRLEADFYDTPEVMLPEDNNYPCRIEESYFDGQLGKVYVFRLEGDSPTAYLDPRYLEKGRQWSKGWTSVVQEYNTERGQFQMGSKFKLRGQMGSFGQQMVVSDEAWRQSQILTMEFRYKDENGAVQSVKGFLPYAEALHKNELMSSINRAMVYGKKENKKSNKNGLLMKTGAGVRQQLQESWNKVFNGTFSLQQVYDHIFNIQFGRVSEENRAVTGITGTLGSVMWHRAIAADARSFLTVDSNFISAKTSNTSTPHLAYGAQFTRYNGPSGVQIDMVVEPMYDSIENCGRTHPQFPGRPIDSARVTFLDFGSFKTDNNIKMLTRDNSYSYGFHGGTYTPNGPVQGGSVNSMVAGYTLFADMTAGIVVHDPTRCSEMIPEIND